MKEDYIDRFAEVAKGLGLEHRIAEKIANFIHLEIQTAKRCSKPVEGEKGICGVKLDCHIHDWRAQ